MGGVRHVCDGRKLKLAREHRSVRQGAPDLHYQPTSQGKEGRPGGAGHGNDEDLSRAERRDVRGVFQYYCFPFHNAWRNRQPPERLPIFRLGGRRCLPFLSLAPEVGGRKPSPFSAAGTMSRHAGSQPAAGHGVRSGGALRILDPQPVEIFRAIQHPTLHPARGQRQFPLPLRGDCPRLRHTDLLAQGVEAAEPGE